MRPLVPGCTALALLAGVAMAFSGWTNEGNLTQSCPCGGVAGTVGAVQALTPNYILNTPTAVSMEHGGKLGAKWNGLQHHVCGHPARNVTNYAEHVCSGITGLGFNPGLSLTLKSTPDIGGTSNQWVMGTPWRWMATANVQKKKPKMQAWDPSSGIWQDLGGITVTSDTQGDAAGNDPGPSGGAIASAMMPISSTRGDTRYSVTVPSGVDQVRVYFEWDSVGGPVSGDNCNVANERVLLSVRALSACL